MIILQTFCFAFSLTDLEALEELAIKHSCGMNPGFSPFLLVLGIQSSKQILQMNIISSWIQHLKEDTSVYV